MKPAILFCGCLAAFALVLGGGAGSALGQEAPRAKAAQARERDWDKLKELLPLGVIPERNKKRWAERFVADYGRRLEENPYIDELSRYLSSGPAKTPIVWVEIPGGSFMMGAQYLGLNAQPHRVTVETFEIAKTEVTRAQYQVCVDAGVCRPPACGWPAAGEGNAPVVCVAWEQAAVFSKWAGGRLPSEAEWEYAARSGGRDWKYPWGDEDPTCRRAVISGCSSKAEPVCSRPAGNTAQGLCDMSGNVWEWVQDWYHDSYDEAPVDGRAWEEPPGVYRVFRGGSWSVVGSFARPAGRSSFDPGSRDDYLGFRPARRRPASASREDVQWVTIPGGTFTMGSSDADLTWSRPLHQVTVKSFQMAKTLVTNKQYAACVRAGACAPAGDCGEAFKGEDQPVVCVDWHQAGAFSEWVGGRLPSEAEWEYAARSAGKDWKYPWGNEKTTCSMAVMSGCGDGRNATAPVCSKPAGNTQQGLCDMAGNVWQWVQDVSHGSYKGAPTDGGAWEDDGRHRVYRGGSWRDFARDTRSADRDNTAAEHRYDDLGFRPAR